jgi:XRE family transcriptional regulator, master regulator for biofilm formation
MIGDKIKTIRKSRGMSLSQLAYKTGISKSYISSLERNLQSNPSIEVLEKMSAILHTSMEDFLSEESYNLYLIHKDNEWQQIIQEAIKAGVTKEQIKELIKYTKWKRLEE